MFDSIAQVFGAILSFIYNNLAFHNYGLSIIIFTILIKLLILPLTVRQYNATVRQNELQPQVMELYNKYKNDRKRQSYAVVELYKENKANPVAGCLPLMIQLPVLVILFMVISHPLRYMAHKSIEVINALVATLPTEALTSRYQDIAVINYYSANPDKLSTVSDMLSSSDLINLNFLSMNLGEVPNINFLFTGDSSTFVGISTLLLLLIPILAFITSYISTNYAEKFSKNRELYQKRKAMAPQAGLAGALQNMSIFTPFMSALICFAAPAGLGLYWICSNTFMILQQIYMHTFVYDRQELPSKESDESNIKDGKSNKNSKSISSKTSNKNNVSNQSASNDQHQGHNKKKKKKKK